MNAPMKPGTGSIATVDAQGENSINLLQYINSPWPGLSGPSMISARPDGVRRRR